MEKRGISKNVLQRLPRYLGYLKTLPTSGDTAKEYISATALATALDMGEVQVRKDLAAVSGAGKPKVGYFLSGLIQDIENFLGFQKTDNTVVVGAGKLGLALLEYEGLENYGLDILASFDNNKDIIDNKIIFDVSILKEFCIENDVKIGIITVPSKSAQHVCDLMVESGILAVMNFAPTHLTAPENIVIQNQDFATTFAILSRHIRISKQL